MTKRWAKIIGLVAAFGFAGWGCDDGGSDPATADGLPAIDVTGNWDTWEDNVYLGVMTLDLDANGLLKGTLVTTQGAEARLSGSMEGYVAEFWLQFPNEFYQATLTFSQDGSGANGLVVDTDGFSRYLRLAPQLGT